MDTVLLLSAAAVTTTVVACTAAGNTHYRQPLPSTGETSCAVKLGRQLWGKSFSSVLLLPSDWLRHLSSGQKNELVNFSS